MIRFCVKLTILTTLPILAIAGSRFLSDRADGNVAEDDGGSSLGPAGPSNLPENFRNVSGRIYSGAGPVGSVEFGSLRIQGIETVISVDGAKPDAEAARRHGLTYVHLPIGYAGVPMPVAAAVGAILESGDAPLYIHCHHGKHRGPAVAAIAAILDGALDRKEALQFLEISGTGQEYTGLWRDVGEFPGLPEGIEPAPLVSAAPVNDFAAAMAETDRTFDRLKALLKLESNTGVREEARHEATLLMESFREMGRLEEAGDFAAGLKQSAALSGRLRENLAGPSMAENASADLRLLKAGCVDCHREHRN